MILNTCLREHGFGQPAHGPGTAKNSEVILDAGGAQNLLGRGDMLVGGPIPIVRLQAALTTADDVSRALGR